MRDSTRRRVLGLSGTAVVTALAGCGIPGGGEGEDDEGGEGGEGGEEEDEGGEGGEEEDSLDATGRRA